MTHFAYILRCSDNSYYTGITWNLKKRISEHNSGIKTSIPKSRLPAKLVFWQKFETISLAAQREKEIKGWRREKKEKLIKSLYLEVKQFTLRSETTKGTLSSVG